MQILVPPALLVFYRWPALWTHVTPPYAPPTLMPPVRLTTVVIAMPGSLMPMGKRSQTLVVCTAIQCYSMNPHLEMFMQI
jgi:hypothetical protein